MDERGPDGQSPLHLAALKGDTGAVRALLEAGANPNAADSSGSTPLHCALETKHLQVARMLVAAGASLDARDQKGVTARDLAKGLALWETEH
jgi:ankyrin repeat protein